MSNAPKKLVIIFFLILQFMIFISIAVNYSIYEKQERQPEIQGVETSSVVKVEMVQID
jgi:hypothetical protein